MSSHLAERLGVQTPQIVHLPPNVASLEAAQEAIELAEAYGVAGGHALDESQQFTLRAALGERADGSWAASTVADFEPRQNGKNDTINARELAGLILFGEKLIIHTAHEFPTANESFLRLVAVFEAWGDLRRKVARIRYANGEQGIELLSGQRLKYRARTGGSGRGFAKADLIVYDEAQHLGREHIAASGPAKLANPNSQTWYAGSGGLSTSAVAWEIRRAAVNGTGGRLAYTEMTAEQVSWTDGKFRTVVPSDLRDRDVWYSCIPGLGRWVTEEGVEALWDELGTLAPRELTCVWDADATEDVEAVIPVTVWADLLDDESTIASHRQWALSVAPDRRWWSIGVAGRRVDGRVHVAWAVHEPGVVDIERVAEMYAQDRTPLRVHKNGPEASLINPLRERGVEVVEVSGPEFGQATGQFIDLAIAGDLRHRRQPSLDKALAGAVLRVSTDGASVWSQRQSQVEITPLVAVTVALGGVPAEAVRLFAY